MHNLIADAVTEEEFLALLRREIARHGESAVEGLVLVREDGRYVASSKSLVAADGDLLQRVRATGSQVAARR